MRGASRSTSSRGPHEPLHHPHTGRTRTHGALRRGGAAVNREALAHARELLTYDPSSGEFLWIERAEKYFQSAGQHTAEHNCKVWNAKYAGKPAGYLDRSVGYKRLCILTHKIWAHRLAWWFIHNEMPKGQIDHIDGNKTNNRQNNLRDVPASENRKNMPIPKNNTSGVVGVWRNEKNKKWDACIGMNGRTIHIGSFASFEEAVMARKDAERDAGFHKNHGRIRGE